METIKVLSNLLIQELQKEQEHGTDVSSFVYEYRKTLYQIVRQQKSTKNSNKPEELDLKAKKENFQAERRILGELLYAMLIQYSPTLLLSSLSFSVGNDIAYITRVHENQMRELKFKNLYVVFEIMNIEGNQHLRLSDVVILKKDRIRMPEEDINCVIEGIKELFPPMEQVPFAQ